MFAVKFAVVIAIILGLILLVRWLSKKPNSVDIADSSARDELEEASTSFESAKEHLKYADEKVLKEQKAAEDRLEETENLKKEIDSSKSIIN
jgi:hypothetical protein